MHNCLSLQYGAGWIKFKEMVRLQTGAILSDMESQRIVNLYRHVHYKVVDLHARCNDIVLPDIASGGSLLPVDEFAWCLTAEDGFGVGAQAGVVYHDLRQTPGTNQRGEPSLEWNYTAGRKSVKVYGGKVCENLCQYVARMIVLWQTARINQRYPVALTVHDEAVILPREDEVEEAKAYMQECLSLAPPWCRGHIPLACEISYGQTYAECK